VRQAIQNATNSLGRIYREVFFLRDVQNLSTKETATILGISEGAVKIRLLRARLQMRDALAPGFDGCWFNGQPYQKVRPW
jgi:RNA polymerase sigma-70 factor (ECF subfamily)